MKQGMVLMAKRILWISAANGELTYFGKNLTIELPVVESHL
jgi:hypothetical protein